MQGDVAKVRNFILINARFGVIIFMNTRISPNWLKKEDYLVTLDL